MGHHTKLGCTCRSGIRHRSLFLSAGAGLTNKAMHIASTLWSHNHNLSVSSFRVTLYLPKMQQIMNVTWKPHCSTTKASFMFLTQLGWWIYTFLVGLFVLFNDILNMLLSMSVCYLYCIEGLTYCVCEGLGSLMSLDRCKSEGGASLEDWSLFTVGDSGL